MAGVRATFFDALLRHLHPVLGQRPSDYDPRSWEYRFRSSFETRTCVSWAVQDVLDDCIAGTYKHARILGTLQSRAIFLWANANVPTGRVWLSVQDFPMTSQTSDRARCGGFEAVIFSIHAFTIPGSSRTVRRLP